MPSNPPTPHSRMTDWRQMPARGLLFIVSAPSGAGKTTLVERLVEQTAHLKMSRAYTSRTPPEGEDNGVDYNFLTPPEVEAAGAGGVFPEWAGVVGDLYGKGPAATH